MYKPWMNYSLTDCIKMSDFWRNVEDEPCSVVVMQYIGIKDMNNKKIFEGDILTYGMLSVAKNNIIIVPGRKIMTEIKLTFAVEWDYKMLLQIQQITESNPDLEHVEIVGNVYENPDILENLKNAGNN